MPLERIRRHREPLARVVTVECRPVDRDTTNVKRRYGREQRFPVVLALAERRQPGHVFLADTAPAEAQQRRMGADLEEHAMPAAVQSADRRQKLHRRHDVPAPIVSVRRHTGRQDLSGHVRHKGDARRGVGDGLRLPPERVEHRRHERRMKRVRHRQPPASRIPSAVEGRADRVDRGLRSRHDDLVRSR